MIVCLYCHVFKYDFEADVNDAVYNTLGAIPFSVIKSEIGIGIAIGDFKSFLTYQQIE
jgi:hypothetical protein